MCRRRRRSGGCRGSKTQRKNTLLTHHLTPWHSRQTPTAPQRETTRGKPCYYVTHREPKISPSLNLKMGPRGPKNLENDPASSFFFLTAVPRVEENTVQKWSELEISKKRLHFCNVHFSLYKKHIFVKPCLKQHAFMVYPLRISSVFLYMYTPTLMFFYFQKGWLKPRRGLEMWLPHRNFELREGPIPTRRPLRVLREVLKNTFLQSV